MNADKLSRKIRKFVTSNRGVVRQLPLLQTQILELAAVMAAADHYKSFGYAVEFHNPSRKRSFVVKSSSRGHPWNFSRIRVKRQELEFEIHMNLSIMSARDPGVYCVDVAITQPAVVPKVHSEEWRYLPNQHLVSFAEVKKLVVYPMLLAHFIGIVHELTPSFLEKLPSGFANADHFAPALITVGYLTSNSREIVTRYKSRGISVNVEANFDVRFSSSSSGYQFGRAETAVTQQDSPSTEEALLKKPGRAKGAQAKRWVKVATSQV